MINTTDFRMTATALIGRTSGVLFIASLPMMAISSANIFIPLAVLITSAVSTASVWLFSGKTMDTDQGQIKDLQERMNNLEAIVVSHSDDSRWFNLQKELNKNV